MTLAAMNRFPLASILTRGVEPRAEGTLQLARVPEDHRAMTALGERQEEKGRGEDIETAIKSDRIRPIERRCQYASSCICVFLHDFRTANRVRERPNP